MASKYLIKNPGKVLPKETLEKGLAINEFFCDTIQGEGITAGIPASFLRLQGCTLDCVWCDTPWRYGRYFTFSELFVLIEQFGLDEKLRYQHLVLTGGSPLKQQTALYEFLLIYKTRYGYKPIVEVENECVLLPTTLFLHKVDIWNNSPKLESSGMRSNVRYKPEVIDFMSNLRNSTFKFVVSTQDDWNEIYHFFLKPKLVDRRQVILMPLGATVEELEKNRDFVVECAVDNGVRYCTREQLIVNRP